MAEGIPAFQPRVYEAPGVGEEYEDGRVFGAVETFTTPDGKKGIIIHEWSSSFPGHRHSAEALQWLRGQGYEHITANGVGLIEDGVGDIATYYWMHMHSKGLVNELFDDNAGNITPGHNPPQRASLGV